MARNSELKKKYGVEDFVFYYNNRRDYYENQILSVKYIGQSGEFDYSLDESDDDLEYLFKKLSDDREILFFEDTDDSIVGFDHILEHRDMMQSRSRKNNKVSYLVHSLKFKHKITDFNIYYVKPTISNKKSGNHGYYFKVISGQDKNDHSKDLLFNELFFIVQRLVDPVKSGHAQPIRFDKNNEVCYSLTGMRAASEKYMILKNKKLTT